MTDNTANYDDSHTTLTTVRKKKVYCPDTAFYGDCRDVEDFEKLNRVGEGTYGVVYRVKDTKSGSVVALKKIRMERETDGMPISSLREISILKRMKHPNIVNVSDVAVGPKLDSIFLVMEYCEQDLGTLLDMISTPYTLSEVKCLMTQLLKGLEYCHSHSIIHRDLKMSNLLLTSTGLLKIADFGLARTLSLPGKPMTPNVVTLWYRSPELLYGDANYTTAVDLWSAGCIMGELLQHRPLLPGNTEQSQLNLIVKLLGTPNDHIWPGFTQLPLGKALMLPKQDKNTLKLVFPRISDQSISLLAGLLTYNPRSRLTVRQALQHPYFREPPRAQDPAMLPTYPEIRNLMSEKEK
ncbi:kinase-like domain-containing protein [Halteromyces radiatus]|uniref:kinase-like domain-containing protein n=1 Tax=Halteromyces radiatus TaxID=101107 RepID=UPI0022203B2D|nr:kinase-like domain-containing protein [Halteromyces radiatus]KAI8096862.1 kinase-like domain-containing protein [Halteromyces radiatus]